MNDEFEDEDIPFLKGVLKKFIPARPVPEHIDGSDEIVYSGS